MSMDSTPSPVRIMLVDDSAVVRGLISRALKEQPNFHVVASASNGAMALQILKNETVDVILLDIEMPEMDGLTALPKLLELKPEVKIIMVSTLSQRGAEISMQALALGAADYVPKPSTRTDAGINDNFYRELREKVAALGASKQVIRPLASSRPEHVSPAPISAPAPGPAPLPRAPETPKPQPATSPAPKDMVSNRAFTLPRHTVKAIAIGSSTGGPQALMQILGAIKTNLPDIPIFITQHMPPTFTAILADHISKSSGKPCMEAKHGEVVRPGHIYIAPGDYHMVPHQEGGQVVLKLNQDPPVNYCRPSVDPMLTALAKIYGNNLLTLILTGMGHDGLDGCRAAVAAGGMVFAQDEASCVVYGMPKAVVDAKIAAAALPLGEIPSFLLKAAEVHA